MTCCRATGASLASVVLLAALVACAAPPESTAQRESTAERIGNRQANCFRVSTVDSWRTINDRELVIFGPRRKDAWHVKLFGFCSGLRFTEQMGFRARGSSFICGDPGDELLFEDGRCNIASVRAISGVEVAELTDPKVRGDIGKDPYLQKTEEKKP